VFAALLSFFLLVIPSSAQAGGNAVVAGAFSVGLWLNPLWFLPFILVVGFWLYLVSWVTDDATGVELNSQAWSAIFLGIGWGGTILTFFLHPLFVIVFLLSMCTMAIYYIKERNTCVPFQFQIFTSWLGTSDAKAALNPPGSSKPKTSKATKKIINEEDGDINEYLTENPDSDNAVEFLGDLLARADKGMVSKLAIVPGSEAYVVEIVKDGVKEKLEDIEPELGREVVAVVVEFCRLKQREKPRSKLKVFPEGESVIDINVKGIKKNKRTGISFSMADKVTPIYDKEPGELGMDKSLVEKIKKLVNTAGTSVVLSAPGKSGRTATYYSVLSLIDIFTKDVISFEKRSQKELNQIKQVNVDLTSGAEFEKALSAVLREEPHVLAADGLYNSKVADGLFEFAAEGGIMLGTVKTDSITEVIKVLRKKVSSKSAAKSLKALTNQRLVRRLCLACREVVEPDPGLLEKLKIDPEKPGQWFGPAGCEKCMYTGFDGLVAIFEILTVNDKVRALMLEKDITPEKVRKAAGSKNYRSLYRHGINKVREGVTTLDEIRRATGSK